MKVIGFANKYFTLWDVVEHEIDNGLYKTVFNTNSFIKNISMDKETAFAKYPGIQFDESLRGHYRSFDSQPRKIWNDFNTFRFGKYNGEDIEKNQNTEYIVWYYENCQEFDDNHKEFIQNVLRARGYEFETYTWESSYDHQIHTSERMLSPEQLAQRHADNENMEAIKSILSNNENVDVLMERNLNDEGDYSDNNYLIYHFNDYVVREYNGYPYGMPAINGKGKRVKGKVITITDYTWSENNGVITINIDKFEIKK